MSHDRLEPIVAEEFGAWAKARLARENYAALAAFRGPSAIKTYLTVVVMTLYRQYPYRRPPGQSDMLGTN